MSSDSTFVSRTIIPRIQGPCARRRAFGKESSIPPNGAKPPPNRLGQVSVGPRGMWSSRTAISRVPLLPSSVRGGRREPSSGSWSSGPAANGECGHASNDSIAGIGRKVALQWPSEIAWPGRGGAPLGLAGGDGAAGGAEGAEAGEEFVGGGDVFGDLGAEFFGAAKFLFLAKTLPEVDFDVPRWKFPRAVRANEFPRSGPNH